MKIKIYIVTLDYPYSGPFPQIVFVTIDEKEAKGFILKDKQKRCDCADYDISEHELEIPEKYF